MAIWKLTIEDDEGQKTVVPLVRDEYTIGRREGHQIRLTERNVSRDHAKLRKSPDGYAIEDLGSYNGVFINGHRLAESQRLLPGDLLLIGDFRIEAHNDDAARAVVAPVQAQLQQPPSTPPVSIRPAVTEARADKASRLVLLTGEGGGKEFALDKPVMIIGRGDDVDVRVNHSSVSRHHAELHAVDAGYEVVDQASANGIRINGQDVKKALLTPGDTLELGDVQLKYLGANQAFVFDAAAAEAAREHEMRGGRGQRKSGAMTWVIVILLVAGAGIGGVVLARSTGKDDPQGNGSVAAKSGTPTTPVSDDGIAKGLKLKETDPFAAHEAVSDIGKDSPLRKDPRYIEIENAWADKFLKQLEVEPDETKKRDGLKAVLESGADQSYRTSASDMLAALNNKVAVASSTSSIDPSGKHPHPSNTPPPLPPTTTVKPPPTTTTPPTATKTVVVPTATTAPPAATGTPGNCPSWKGRYDEAMRAKDYECVRTMLMPRLNSNSLSTGEARYLKAACGALGDTACQKRAADKTAALP